MRRRPRIAELCLALGAGLTAQDAPRTKLVVTEQALSRKLPGHQLVMSSYDNQTVAWWQQEGERFRVFVNGKPSNWQVGVPPRFLTNPSLVSCEENRSYQGVDGESYDIGNGLVNTFRFSRNGSRCAYQFDRGARRHVVVVTRGRHDELGSFAIPPHDEEEETWVTFSPNGKRIAYPHFDGEHWYIVLDGEFGPPFEFAGFPEFSANSKRCMYSAEGRTIVDHEPVVGALLGFTPDDGRIIRVVGQPGDRQLVIGSRRIGTGGHDHVGDVTIRESDGTIAYATRKRDVLHWWIGDRRSKPIELRISQKVRVTFSPSLAYAVLTYTEGRSTLTQLIRTHDESELFWFPGTEQWGFDGREAEFSYTRGDSVHTRELVTGRTRILPGPCCWTWSPNRRRRVFEHRQITDDPWWFRVQGSEAAKPGPRYSDIGDVEFDREGHRFAFWAERSDKPFVVVDGVETKPYDVVTSNTVGYSWGARTANVTFLNRKLIRGFAIRDRRVLRFEIKIDER